ncbi:hypothetical protein G6F66_015146 [Rhizopus arrhizus]|nr:hypothetical protein G6F66_015146 [Rhizopus arrhizus]
MGYDHRFITPLHPSANGLSERFVQTVKKLLAKSTNGVGNDWDDFLPSIQLAMNNRIQWVKKLMQGIAKYRFYSWLSMDTA